MTGHLPSGEKASWWWILNGPLLAMGKSSLRPEAIGHSERDVAMACGSFKLV